MQSDPFRFRQDLDWDRRPLLGFLAARGSAPSPLGDARRRAAGRAHCALGGEVFRPRRFEFDNDGRRSGQDGRGLAFPALAEDEFPLGYDLDELSGGDLAAGHSDPEDASGLWVDLAVDALPGGPALDVCEEGEDGGG